MINKKKTKVFLDGTESFTFLAAKYTYKIHYHKYDKEIKNIEQKFQSLSIDEMEMIFIFIKNPLIS